MILFFKIGTVSDSCIKSLSKRYGVIVAYSQTMSQERISGLDVPNVYVVDYSNSDLGFAIRWAKSFATHYLRDDLVVVGDEYTCRIADESGLTCIELSRFRLCTT